MNQITFIGGGNMARSLIGGLVSSGADAGAIHVAEPDAEARANLEREFGVTTHDDNNEAISGAEAVMLAVKPQVLPGVCEAVAASVAAAKPLVVSIAAGIRTDQIERWLDTPAAIVRVMPNTPSLIGAGANGLFANARVDKAQRELAQTVLEASGICEWVDDESLMDTVTAVSGSAPAYFFLIVEAMEDAAAARGLPREAARHLAAQTCLGAGRMMIESGEAPAELRRRVTSPNGTTQAALDSLDDSDLRGIMARAMDAARERGAELAAAND
ncbi:MAG TPA: pyrroline-5-carboxylate reductase [Oleiagrimonas sp.]|nr:pyrroline-5-carboxylate reductase [Oleiagrimonas sp.]